MSHTVRVSYAKRRDHYIATSNDLRGLFIANTTLSSVYEEVPEAIKLLFKVKYGLNVSVKESSAPDKVSIEELVYEAEEMPLAA